MTVALGVIVPLAAQQPERPSDGPVLDREFEERLLVQEVELWVRVLARGKVVEGLKVDDFSVWQGERELEIVAFEALDRNALPSPSSAESRSESRSESRGESSVEVDALADTGRVFLIVFVLEPEMRGYLARAVQGVRTMVSEQRRPGDWIAVATCSGPACRLVLGPSTDEERILLALDVVSATLSAKPRAAQQAQAALYDSSPKTMVELANALGLDTAMLIQPGILQVAQRGVASDFDLASIALPAGALGLRLALEPDAIDERLIDMSQRFVDSVATDRAILSLGGSSVIRHSAAGHYRRKALTPLLSGRRRLR